jgi:hypothetical protein
MRNIGSAHPLVEVNIRAKFEENLSISVGLTEPSLKKIFQLV